MRNEIIEQYKRLKLELLAEKNSLEERLNRISEALNGASAPESAGAPTPVAEKPAVRRGRPPGKGMSAAGRARIAEAQRSRWAKAKGSTSPGDSPKSTGIKKKRTMTASAKAAIAEAARKRWAAAKKAGKNRL